MVLRNDSHSEIDSAWSQLPVSGQKLRDRKAIRRYVEEIDRSSPGQLCVLYVNVALDLIGAMRWRGESAPALVLETRTILRHGAAIGAAGFMLARTDPDENYYPDRLTVLAVSELRRFSAEFDLPLLDYLVFSVGQTFSVGGPNVRSN
jgi:DNA repair protein RadC